MRTSPADPHETGPITFEDFWPTYVRAHASKTSRTLHVIGTSLALACLVAAIFKRRPWLALLAPLAGYGFARCGHFVEHNHPTSASHPVLRVRANLLLWWKTLAGEMDAEVARILADEPVARDGAASAHAPQPASDLN